jgi:flagellar biosynthesis anti-sigma factor FlgM
MANTIHPDVTKITPPGANEQVSASGQKAGPRASTPMPVADANEVSGDAELYGFLVAQARAIEPHVDEDKVSAIRSQIEQGTYNPDPDRVAAAVARGIK